MNNKCFMYITHNCKSTLRHLQQEDKGKLCIAKIEKINYLPVYQNQPVCLKQMLNYQRLWAWCQLFYISQELILFTYTAVLKKGKLQHAAIYDVKLIQNGVDRIFNDIMQMTTQKAAWCSQVLRATASFQYSELILLFFQNVAAVSYLSQDIPV